MRHAVHLIVSLLMWALFGWYWYLVMQRQIGPSSLRAVGLLLLIALAGLALTLLWVAHNKRVASPDRRLTPVPLPEPRPAATDHLGRPLLGPDQASLRQAKVVVVAIDGHGRKTLRETKGVTD